LGLYQFRIANSLIFRFKIIIKGRIILIIVCIFSLTKKATFASVLTAKGYVWTIPTTAVIDSPSAPLAANGLKIKVRFTAAGANDSVYVQAIGAGGCPGAKKVLKITTTNCVTPVFANIIHNSSKAIKRKETFVFNNFNKKNTRR